MLSLVLALFVPCLVFGDDPPHPTHQVADFSKENAITKDFKDWRKFSIVDKKGYEIRVQTAVMETQKEKKKYKISLRRRKDKNNDADKKEPLIPAEKKVWKGSEPIIKLARWDSVILAEENGDKLHSIMQAQWNGEQGGLTNGYKKNWRLWRENVIKTGGMFGKTQETDDENREDKFSRFGKAVSTKEVVSAFQTAIEYYREGSKKKLHIAVTSDRELKKKEGYFVKMGTGGERVTVNAAKAAYDDYGDFQQYGDLGTIYIYDT